MEIATIQAERRNREANRIVDQTAFNSFSYSKGMNFAEERRRLIEVQEAARRHRLEPEANDEGDDY